MQKLSACRKRPSEIQRRRSTSSWCMIAICPAGPPKLMKPSFSQNRNASEKGTFLILPSQSSATPPVDGLCRLLPENEDYFRNPQNLAGIDRKSTRLNSSHVEISYAVFCL